MISKQEVTKTLPATEYSYYRCSVIASLKLFATKWKPCIIAFLATRPMRYNELFRAIPNISRKMLSQHLDEMEKDMLIERIVYDRKLQKVEYRLSEKGESLMPLMEHLQDWGLKHIPGCWSMHDTIVAAGMETRKAS